MFEGGGGGDAASSADGASTRSEYEVEGALEQTPTSRAGDHWLDALHDPVASLYAFSWHLELADVAADGDTKLVVAHLGTGDYGMKLKYYKGPGLFSDYALLETPNALLALYIDDNVPRTPVFAVSSGAAIYVFRNFRPFYKFNMPALSATGPDDTTASPSLITCIAKINRSVPDEDAVACLVIGTEDGWVSVLDPAGFAIVFKARLPSPPSVIETSGVFAVEHRIVAACRNGLIYTIKGGKLMTPPIEPGALVIGMVRLDKCLLVACADSTLQSFSLRGQRLWNVRLPALPYAVAPLSLKTRNMRAMIVSLANGEVRVYNERELVSSFLSPEVVRGMVFGRYGREDGALAMTTVGGGLIIKYLRRTATLDKGVVSVSDVAIADKVHKQSVIIPKMSRLFAAQAEREKEHGPEIHRLFQRDLQRLRLVGARAYAKTLAGSMNPVGSTFAASSSADISLKLNAQVLGIGPMFKLVMEIQNIGRRAAVDVPVVIASNPEVYALDAYVIRMPMLVPGPVYREEVYVECLSPSGLADKVRVTVCDPTSHAAIITAVITMPPSEILIDTV